MLISQYVWTKSQFAVQKETPLENAYNDAYFG